VHVLEIIADAIRGSKFDGDLFEVGGSVRDRLLGLPSPEDFDLVTQQSATDLANFLWNCGITTGKPVIYQNFGTAMIAVCNCQIEIVQARRESYRTVSRKPIVVAASYLEDARRRDFTINTLLSTLRGSEVIDLLGNGREDLFKGVLRTPLDPVVTFDEDPLRMLRAVRFSAKLSFSYADGLTEAILQNARRLEVVSIERIRDEFMKMLCGVNASKALEDMRRLNLLKCMLPELNDLKDVAQGNYHHLDVWGHTLLVLDNLESTALELRLAALFHDVGKPQTKIGEGGKTRFIGHETVGEDLTRTAMTRLRFSKDITERVCRLVKNHMRLGSAPQFSAAAARKLLRDLGEDVSGLLDLVQADASSLAPGVKQLNIGSIRNQLGKVSENLPSLRFESPLSGRELMELTRLPPGQHIGDLKAWLLERVLEGELAQGDKEKAASLVKRKMKDWSQNMF